MNSPAIAISNSTRSAPVKARPSTGSATGCGGRWILLPGSSIFLAGTVAWGCTVASGGTVAWGCTVDWAPTGWSGEGEGLGEGEGEGEGLGDAGGY